jgi:serine/threonine-protein kinase
MLSPLPSSQIPGRIGRYAIEHRIGAGGMALTYKCRLEGIGGFTKRVVVKILHPDHVGEEGYEQMFLDEARLSARLHHNNVAQVFEVGDDHGIPYMVMEYVDGPNLARVTKLLGGRADRPFGHIAHIFAGVCRGLSHAHGLCDDEGRHLGIVHRDVSLGNIVISRSGVSKVIDFGIAQWADKRNVTQVGLLKGKLHYMAPEQLEGEADHRSDIYQVGVCLYWMTTGRPPFHHDDPAKLWQARLKGNITPPSKLVRGYPKELEEVVLTALAQDPAHRWQSADEMADMLEAFGLSHPRWASGKAEVARWIDDTVPLTEDEELSLRQRSNPQTTGKTPSLGELMQGGSDETASGHAGSERAAPLREGSSEPTMRPEVAGPRFSPLQIAAVSSALTALIGVVVLAVVLLLGSSRSRGDEAAALYLEEAARLEAAGDLGGARTMLARAASAEPDDPELVVAVSRMGSRLGAAEGP